MTTKFTSPSRRPGATSPRRESIPKPRLQTSIQSLKELKEDILRLSEPPKPIPDSPSNGMGRKQSFEVLTEQQNAIDIQLRSLENVTRMFQVTPFRKKEEVFHIGEKKLISIDPLFFFLHKKYFEANSFFFSSRRWRLP